MSEKNDKLNEVKVKSVKYPVIYSYIYEREREDIIRLSSKFKRVKKSAVNNNSNKVVTGFEIKNGVAKPIYADKLSRVESVAKKPAIIATVSESGVIGKVHLEKGSIANNNVSMVKGKSSVKNKK